MRHRKTFRQCTSYMKTISILVFYFKHCRYDFLTLLATAQHFLAEIIFPLTVIMRTVDP
jgi:hypothetical protein